MTVFLSPPSTQEDRAQLQALVRVILVKLENFTVSYCTINLPLHLYLSGDPVPFLQQHI